MKKLLPFCLIIIFSCNSLSKSEKESLEISIEFHNINSVINYNRVSTSPGYTGNWNIPYDIRNDTALTLQKYLDYCKSLGLNPKTHIQFL